MKYPLVLTIITGLESGMEYRVELHPATDWWMRGDRYGTVENVTWANGIPMYTVRLDKSGKVINIYEKDILDLI